MADMLIRNVDAEVMARFRRAASARGMAQCDYLAALLALHDVARAIADTGNQHIAAELEARGLETVRA